MIYKENEKKEPLTPPPQPTSIGEDRSRAIFSSFRKKSVIVDRHAKQPLRVGVNTASRDLPKLKDLIYSSGIFGDFKEDVDDVDGKFDELWNATASEVGKIRYLSVNSVLKDVIQEVLTIDAEDSSGRGRPSHPNLSLRSEDERIEDVVYIPPSWGSNQSSFEEIPHYCTPQFQPEYLTPTMVNVTPQSTKTLPPPPIPESSQEQEEEEEEVIPKFGNNECRTPSRPPSMVEARSRRHNTGYSPEEADDIINSSHYQRRVPRLDSSSTYKTIVSEITLPLEMKSPLRGLRIDPRAPQFRMAMEQDELFMVGDITQRAKNRSLPYNHADYSNMPPPPRRPQPDGECPSPPRRHDSQDYPTPKASSYRKDASEDGTMTTTLRESDYVEVSSLDDKDLDDEPPLMNHAMRRGTIEGPGASQPASKTNPRHGASLSQVRQKQLIPVPTTSQQDSNPLLHPALLAPHCGEGSDEEASISLESIVGPFVSPSVSPRKFRVLPNTPQQDANPLLFPLGIECYRSSPAKVSTTSDQARVPENTSGERELPIIALPMGTANSEPVFPTSVPSSSQHARQQHLNVHIKLTPRQITNATEKEVLVHTGVYSGTLNKFQQMDGNGVFWFDSGDIYIGQFKCDMLHGVGIMAVEIEDGSKQILKGRFRRNEYVGID
jgi:hypothetical protein